jgi:pilus assembly protein TadC
MLAASGWLLARAAAWRRLRVDASVREVESYGFQSPGREIDEPSGRGRLDQRLAIVAGRLGRFTAEHLPSLGMLRRGELAAAGIYEVSPETVHGYRVFCALFLPLLVLLFVGLNSGFSLLTVMEIGGALLAGWYLPALAIRHRGRQRLDEIDRELPDLIDLLVATIEAGLGFAGSLSLVASRFEGPLGQELRLTLQQQNLGISNETALNDMLERADTPSMRAFVRTVLRAEALGVSIGQIMRNLATDMRQRRRQKAREKVQKAPIKLLFPLLFLIFPALFIVILYPAVYTIAHSLGGG